MHLFVPEISHLGGQLAVFDFLCRCDERADCSVNASLDIRLESDPCPNTEKYLEAHYVCHSLSEGPPTQGWSVLGEIS